MSRQANFYLRFEDNLTIVEDGSGGYRIEVPNLYGRWETDKEVAFLRYSGVDDGTLWVDKAKLAVEIGWANSN